MDVAVKNYYGFTAESKQYSLTALKENIGLLDIGTIEKVNALVSGVGNDYLEKDKEAIKFKADSYVVKTNGEITTLYL